MQLTPQGQLELTPQKQLEEAEVAVAAAEVAATGIDGAVNYSDPQLVAVLDDLEEAEARMHEWADGSTRWRDERDEAQARVWRDLEVRARRDHERRVRRGAPRMRRPRRRGAGHPRRRRSSSSSRTSSADPGAEPAEPPPPELRLWRHPHYGACSAGLLHVLLDVEAVVA